MAQSAFQKKKYFGQNFLNNKKILEGMVSAAEISKKDIVLEVGPGLGSLTEVLALKAKKVIAIEKDRDLIPILKEKFKNTKNVEIIHGDILTSPLTPLLRKERGRIENRFKVVANIPYYITGKFLRLFLTQTRFRPHVMVLMIQKEVAERIMGTRLRQGSGEAQKESLLSLSVKAYGKPTIMRTVSKNFFSPPPKVDSAIIKISDISDKWFVKHSMFDKPFFEILRTAFQQKRKMLRHSLGRSTAKWQLSGQVLEKYGNKRPEDLSLEDWAKIIGSFRLVL